MYHIYRSTNLTTYAIQLCTGTDGTLIFDTSTKRRTFLDGEFETIHQALGIYLLRQFRVNDAWGELSMGIFDST